MTDLLNFDDDEDNLFQPQEQQSKPSRNLDDIFGTTSQNTTSANTLDDILTPAVQDDIFQSKGDKSKKNNTNGNIDNLFGDDIDNEPDIFSGFPPKSASPNIANPLEDDLLGDFLSTPASGNTKVTTDTFDDLFGSGVPVETDADDNIDDLFAFNQIEPVTQKGNLSESSNLFDVQSEPSRQSVNQSESSDLFDVQSEPSKQTFNQSESSIKLDVQSEPSKQSVDQSESSNLFDIQSEPSKQSVDQSESSNLFDIQSEPSKPSVNQLQSSTDSVDQSRRRIKSNDIPHDESEDSLDMLLDAQPMGTVPSCEDLVSLVEPADTNTANSSNIPISPNTNTVKDSPSKETDPLDDFFGTQSDKQPEELSKEVPINSKLLDDPEEDSDHPEDSEDETKPPVYEEDSKPVTKEKEKPKTNLKKGSMERSFEDLLNGLSDESEPELDDMIVNDMDNTNLESLLETPNKSVRDSRHNDSVFTPPRKPVDLDINTSTPMEKNFPSPGVKVKTPEVKVQTPEDDEFDGERGDMNTFDDNEVVMRPKKQYDTTDDDDLNLGAIEDTNHLDVDVNKHKSTLGKTGSMALRRKPSRKSRKSLLSGGEDAIFQDSTDSKPVSMSNGDDEAANDDDDDNYDLSPPAKKPTPGIMMPLPGMAGRPPSQRLSLSAGDDDDNAMDTKEVKRSSKPPPGAFVLPTLGPRPPKPQGSTSDRPSAESSPSVFEKPALKSVKPVEKSPSADQEQFTGFSRDGLRSSDRSEVDKKSGSEERDVTFQKPSLRSTPKPTRKASPEESMDTGKFEKPALRSTPKPKLHEKPRSEERETDVFESRNLRSVDKQDVETAKDTESDKPVFDKPSLRSTGRKLDSDIGIKKEELKTKTFEKPALKSTNKDFRSDSFKDSSEPSHTFDKPTLRSSSRTNSESTKPDTHSQGIFDKPSLKKTTPSPEKEMKEFSEPKGMFDRPALRKTIKERDRERPVTQEKPEWLQQAANKQTKVLEMIHTSKENHQVEKEVPSWLEKSQLKKTRALPLQDTSNSQSASSSQSDLSNTDDGGHKSSTPRSRNSSVNSDRESERKRTASTTKENNNYSPSWMRQTRAPAVPSSGVLGPAKSLPSLNNSNEVPQWKKELAQRKANRKDKPADEITKKDESVEPEWKKGIALRKTRTTSQSSKDVKSVEPEWKKAAEERHARLRTSSVHDKSDHSGQS